MGLRRGGLAHPTVWVFMWAVGLTLVLLVVAAVTDVARHRIYNWTTYPGIVAALLLRAVEGGWPAFSDGLTGFVGCGLMMLVCFLLFGDIGGGDLKLIAMIGAGLGLHRGIESMLWTFILGGVMGTAILIWKFGILNLVSRTVHHLKLVFQSKGWVPLTAEERAPLQRWLFLAPSALLAVLIVLADERWRWFSGE